MEVSDNPDVLDQILSNRRTTLDHILCLGYGFQRPGMNKWCRNLDNVSCIAEIDVNSRKMFITHDKNSLALNIDTHAPEFFCDLRNFLARNNFRIIDSTATQKPKSIFEFNPFRLLRLGFLSVILILL